MSAWRREALQRVPMLRQDIEQVKDFYKLCLLFVEEVWMAYSRSDIVGDRISHSSEDEALIRGIHAWAGFCLLHPFGSAAYANLDFYFYESLSQNIDVYIVREFYKYIEPDVFTAMQHSQILAYLLGKNKVADFTADYWARRRSMSTENL